MTDNLVQLFSRHHRCGVIMISCECGWWPDDHLPGDRQFTQYDKHLATVFRQYRMSLPVKTQKHEHGRLCYLNECKYPGDFPTDSFRVWAKAREHARYEIDGGAA